MTSQDRAQAAIQVRPGRAGQTAVYLMHPDGQRGDMLWSGASPDMAELAKQYRGYVAAHLDAHAAGPAGDRTAELVNALGLALEQIGLALMNTAGMGGLTGGATVRRPDLGALGLENARRYLDDALAVLRPRQDRGQLIAAVADAARAAEREACLRIAKEHMDTCPRLCHVGNPDWSCEANIAAAIQARGNP